MDKIFIKQYTWNLARGTRIKSQVDMYKLDMSKREAQYGA